MSFSSPAEHTLKKINKYIYILKNVETKQFIVPIHFQSIFNTYTIYSTKFVMRKATTCSIFDGT